MRTLHEVLAKSGHVKDHAGTLEKIRTKEIIIHTARKERDVYYIPDNAEVTIKDKKVRL